LPTKQIPHCISERLKISPSFKTRKEIQVATIGRAERKRGLIKIIPISARIPTT
jgi:hypothetical protein